MVHNALASEEAFMLFSTSVVLFLLLFRFYFLKKVVGVLFAPLLFPSLCV